jgi:chorismate mutase
MLLGTIPPEILTKEAMIVWAVATLREGMVDAVDSPAFPKKITETNGFFPSDVISLQELNTVDGGYRHVIRVLMPVDPSYYGGSNSVWQYAETLVQ